MPQNVMCNFPCLFVPYGPRQSQPCVPVVWNSGHRIPDASMIQLIKDIANIFSPFSENVITSSAVRQATRIPIIKNPILISVVTRRVPIRRSSVVSFVNRARLRYKMMAALIMHIPVNRRDTSSFLQSMQPAWLRM